jgi:endonuclease/exonuclease/phosphatase family metal-dependent hydrolase
MKIVSLNVFGGTVFEPLMGFVERQALDTDVFCFQEVMDDRRGLPGATSQGFRMNLLQELSSRLADFSVYFAPMRDLPDVAADDCPFVRNGLATFVRKGIDVAAHGGFSLCDALLGDDPIGQNALFVTLDAQKKPLTICNVHGISDPGDKLDTPVRLAQSKSVLQFLATVSGEKMVMGDFNLLPETESVKMFERAGFSNLIQDYGIQTTRGAHHKILHPEFGRPPMMFQEFADFTFVSSGVSVRSFAVPDLPLSDHLPMIIECSL